MSLNKVSRLAQTAAAAVTIALVAVVGCASDEVAPPPVAPRLVCPGTVADAVGAPCDQENGICPIGYPCPRLEQQATCTCIKGKFACVDVTNAPLAPGATPACVPPVANADCPATESNLAPCVQHGQQCKYAGLVCPENAGVPNVDLCSCESQGDGGFAFSCHVAQCLPRADAGADGAPADARNDATTPADAGEDGGG